MSFVMSNRMSMTVGRVRQRWEALSIPLWQGPSKYGRYAGSIVDGITNAQGRSTSLKLVPRASSSNLDTTGEPS
jgi:hypothetical protein